MTTDTDKFHAAIAALVMVVIVVVLAVVYSRVDDTTQQKSNVTTDTGQTQENPGFRANIANKLLLPKSLVIGTEVILYMLVVVVLVFGLKHIRRTHEQVILSDYVALARLSNALQKQRIEVRDLEVTEQGKKVKWVFNPIENKYNTIMHNLAGKLKVYEEQNGHEGSEYIRQLGRQVLKANTHDKTEIIVPGDPAKGWNTKEKRENNLGS